MRTPFLPLDSGPLYAETDLSRFPVEPWNTYSLVIFLIISFFWLWKIRNNWKKEKLILCGIFFLLIGTLGGSLYHACRCSELWFLLDVVPIVLLAQIASASFWLKLLRARRDFFLRALFALLCLGVFDILLQGILPRQILVSLFYVLLAVAILLPAFILTRVFPTLDRSPLLWAISLITIAISFRVLDFQPQVLAVFPMGTHFLWHIFGALAGHNLIRFIFRIPKL